MEAYVGNARQGNFELDLSSEAETYHESGRYGYFSLLIQQGERKRQSSFRLTDMARVLDMVDPTRDSWLSQAEFILPNRRVVNLARIGLLFVDIDSYYKPWAQGRSPDAQAQSLVYLCHQEGLPAPSLIIWSGRGLHAKWLLNGTIPRQALPRWNACQRNLVNKLHFLGADPRAKDASRVLRLVDTVNTRNGSKVRVLHVTEGDDSAPVRYSFEWLCELLLPVSRWDLEQHSQRRNKRRKKSSLALVKSGSDGAGLRTFSGRRLAWDRLEDIRILARLRGGVPEGDRMNTLFWQINFLLLSGATYSGQLWHEAAELARQIDPKWGYQSRELSTLYHKARAHEAGEKVELAGRSYPPLYTPKNDTLINQFQISSGEQKQLKTIISTDEARDRDRLRKEKQRRATGVMNRKAYEAHSASRQKPWEKLEISRRTWYRRGKPSAD